MKIKISKLEGKQLDWAVCSIKKFIDSTYLCRHSQDPDLWGKIMEENEISTVFLKPFKVWRSRFKTHNLPSGKRWEAPTPGIAICRCYVAMNTEGDSVEVPKA